MSDLEATSSRGPAAAPITALASGKLRAFAGGGPRFAETDGLVDAFAEVFASIAAATAQPIEYSGSGDGLERGTDSERDHDPVEDDGETVVAESSDSVSRAQTSDGPRLDVAEKLVQYQSEVQNNEGQQTVVAADADQNVVETSDVVAVDVKQLDDVDLENDETPDLAAQTVVEAKDSGDHKRQRRDSPVVDSGESTSHRETHQDRAASTESASELGQETEPIGDRSSSQTPEEGENDEPRVTRRRYTRSEETPENTAATPQSPANQTSKRADASASGTQHLEAANTQGAPAAAEAPTPSSSRNVEAVIANVQTTAPKIDRAAAPANSQAGTRGSTQAIGAAEPKRSEPGATPEAKPNKQNTADTVSRVKLIQRVSKAFQHLGPDGGVVRLRLAPAEMGTVRVEMRINQKKVEARVVAETEAAGAALREHLPDLRARLESFGMQVEQLEIETDLNDQQHSSLLDRDTQQDGRKWQRQGSSRFRPQATNTEDAVSQNVSRHDAMVRVNANGMDVRL